MEPFNERLRGQWTNYLVKFPIEWWVSLTFKYPPNNEYVDKKLAAWSRKLIKEERIQLAYFGVINEFKRTHLHLLALGRNRHGKKLSDVSPARWERAWKAEAKIKPVYDNEGVSDYFERNTILKNGTISEIKLYNTKLLKKVQLIESRKKE